MRNENYILSHPDKSFEDILSYDREHKCDKFHGESFYNFLNVSSEAVDSKRY
jgi:hypothetical protein